MRHPSPGRVAIYLLLGLWSLVCLFPLYWLVLASFKSGEAIGTGPRYVPFVDFQPVLEAWSFILLTSNEHLFLRFFNSFFVASVSACLALLIGAMAAYGLTRFHIGLPCNMSRSANRTILMGIYASRILPPVVLVLPLYIFARLTGTLDTRLALILTYTSLNLPVTTWLLQPVFGKMRTEQEEAASLDGASHLTIFLTIVLPMMKGGLAAAGILVFILCMNEYLFSAYLATDHAMTLTPWIAGQLSIKEGQVASADEDIAHFSAASVLLILPLLAFGGFVRRVLSRTANWKH